MIPKVIHTCWFTKDPNKPLPEKVQKCIESWKKYCPGYEIKVWGIDDWDFREYPYAAQCWNAGVASYAYLSNFFRFWVLYTYGGYYIESDLQLKKRIDDINFDPIHAHFGLINPNEASGSFIAASQGNSVMEHFVKNVFSNKTWINADNSLSLYHDSGEIGTELEKLLDTPLPDISIKVPTTIMDRVTFYPKNYFFPAKGSDGIYGKHLGSLTHYKKISIVMPVWNSEKFLNEAIDSVLSQNFYDFELLCIDDGSIDNSKSIIESYKDDRVVYIGKTHSGIVDSLNIGIKRAIGEYIVRFDSDDIMLPGRLRHQYEYMTSHPEIDILGSGFQWGNGKSDPEYFHCPERKLSIDNFRIGNIICHPATILKRSSILKLPYLYENYYEGCEDYKFWQHALYHDLILATEPTPVIIYRQHKDQVTVKKEYLEKYDKLVSRVKRTYNYKKIDLNVTPELTCIIPFQNEGYEVERTVANIRATVGNNVKIILIDDNSTDGFDYGWVAASYDCQYYYNETNLGVAGSRNFGVEHCTTEYFVLLDAHMRFYEDDWHIELLKNLKENPECLVSSNTVVFGYNKETGLYENEEGSTGRDKFGSYGAYINMDEEGWEFTAKWTGKKMSDEESLIPISCCLGAVYAASKSDWFRLGGLNGLIKYGLDEPLISLKYWLSGGKVLLMKNWGVGHLYRGTSPYSVPLKHLDYNQLYLIHLFSETPHWVKHREDGLRKRVGERRFKEAKRVFESQINEFKKFKRYWESQVAKNSLSWFIENINNKVK